ncbi:MAG: ABC transporter ATP-binding protein [Polyangiaceae bacterium]|nr:ABC transporter ATP-binding protein [Myxococcales bacterium]MCB9586920.1 ABC transporter ATP-binding protein [Polyangiaceae bacterium]MCB9608208.1 ABC transporter ATP-binding protein [Polyangiaceae bacterium]
MSLLEVSDLRIDYITQAGDVSAVDGVSFRVDEDQIFGLAGESGSGKSTVVQGILRLLRPPAAITGGSVRLLGKDLLAMSEAELRRVRWRDASLVFQSAMNALNPVLRVSEQLTDVMLAHEALSPPAARKRAEELLELVGIDSTRLDSFPHELSGGMRQRVVIAIALALRPKLLIMDEPTTALDVVVQKEILAQIAELRHRLGFSVLFITHDLGLMLEFCTHIGVMYAGKLVEVAEADEIYHHPRHPYTQGLLASFPDTAGDQTSLEGIPGSPPDLLHPPPGCRFHPRCSQVQKRCHAELPQLVSLGGNHLAACHVARQP